MEQKTTYVPDVAERADALIIVPPPSPSDTNPPLGPAVLARAGALRGFHVEVADLNIAYLNDFRSAEVGHPSYTLGDHGKNRALVSAAAAHLFDSTGLRKRPPTYLPADADPVAGMHYGFAALDAAVAEATRGGEWRSWLVEQVFSRFQVAPPVVGVSLMGPSQVFLGLVIFALVKELWPASTTVLGAMPFI